ncbi:hypothetical protein OH458_15395 [Vibrio sp. MarTm2]|uniref:RAMP superfamily CRISPR-associated protein n=1 Tax=Vibrio sp. MarTm2 TaxID=2998831 RepID=UPI0022CDA60E|nr:RAMP superfamily CRISPR-associated protein [Vibrio sp. MarTm2]MDA0129453.1 hypothetical protein [Vibrio sp. MarTm2]
MRLYFSLKTIDPIIVSQNTATTMNHKGLDYIPGSTLLGVVASSLYSQIDDSESWDMFHSGQVQFGPCYPVADQQLCLPTPSSWHFDKLATPIINSQYQADEISNHANKSFERDKQTQYKQCRDGYINANGKVANVQRNIVTKTAIDRSKGTVKESQLFSYSYIEPGQTFIGWVYCETEQQRKHITTHLFGEKHIGRSKNSEFGRVKITEQTTLSDPQPNNTNDELVLWCLSDSQCVNKLGLPTLTPSLAELTDGANGELDYSRSFIRHNSASRFNQTRGGLDSEQTCIAKGSVLVFKNVSISESQLLTLANKGIGINRQQGLGWVYVNPEWANSSTLSEGLFSAKSIDIRSNTQLQKGTKPCSPLTQWVAAKLNTQQEAQSQREQAQQLAASIVTAYDNARNYNHIAASHIAGPTRTQWGRVRDVLRHDVEHWLITLFMDQHAICKPKNDELGWGIHWHNGTRLIQFADHCLEQWQQHQPSTLVQTLELLSQYDLATQTDLEKAKKRFLNKETQAQQGVIA